MEVYVPVPHIILKKIFSYFAVKELLPLRLVCKKFNTIIQEILNESLMRSNNKLKKILENTSKRFQVGTVNELLIRYFKIMNYLRSEINIIITTTKNYINEKLFCFSGAAILDYYNKVLSLSIDDFEEHFDYLKIFHLVDSYLNFFDENLEPRLLLANDKYEISWFGVKLFNLLDCSLDLNYKVQLTYLGQYVLLDGKYNGEELHLLENIPTIKKQLRTDAEKRAFVSTIRNNIRWNNLLYCIEKSTAQLSQTCFTPGLLSTSDLSSVIERKFIEKWKDDMPGVSYEVTMKCKANYLPLRASTLFHSNENASIKSSLSIQDYNIDEKDEEFEFNLTMKIRTRLEEGLLKERTIKLFNVGSNCVVSEHTKCNTELL